MPCNEYFTQTCACAFDKVQGVQRGLDIVRVLFINIPFRFDSTLRLLDSVLHHENALKQIQGRKTNDEFVRPMEIHLLINDFQLIRNIAETLEPVRTITRALPSSPSWLSDVPPLITAALDTLY